MKFYLKKLINQCNQKLNNYFEHNINTEINQFKPDIIAIQDSQPAPLGRIVVWCICLLILSALIWSYIATIDIVASSQGKIIPVGSIKVVQSNSNGVIKEIHIKDGSFVNKGDVLFVLDTDSYLADQTALEKSYLAESIKNRRANSLLESINQQKIILPNFDDLDMSQSNKQMQISLFTEQYKNFISNNILLKEELKQKEHEQKGIIKNISQYQKTVEIMKSRVDMMTPLVQKKAISKLQYSEHEEKYIREENNLNLALTQQLQNKAEIDEIKEKIHASYITTKKENLLAAEESFNNLNKIKEELIKNEVLLKYSVIKAPVSGYIQELKYHTVGGVLESAKEMLKIVESGSDLEIETLIASKDIGFIKNGMPVSVKLDAFQFTKYGLVHGTVSNISEDAINDEKLGLVYPTKIKLKEKTIDIDGKKVKLTYGMGLVAEIKTGERRVIEYFISPITKHLDESIKER